MWREREDDRVCEFEAEQKEGILIINCSSCEGRWDLRNSDCLKGVLTALRGMGSTREIILSRHSDKRYSGKAIVLLSEMGKLCSTIEGFAEREPPCLQTDHLSRQQKALIRECKNSPSVVFGTLKKELLTDMGKLYARLREYSDDLYKTVIKECRSCLRWTRTDFIYLFNKLEEFRGFVMQAGLKIVS